MTPKQSAFVDEYCVDKNATQAAIRAGYSKKTAEWIGPQLLGKSHVKAAIDERLATLSEKAGLTTELILSSLAREIAFDPAQLYDKEGNLRPIHEIPEDARKCLVGIDHTSIGGEGGAQVVTKVKWVNPATAREQAMKHLGMFEKDNKQKPEIAVLVLSSADAKL